MYNFVKQLGKAFSPQTGSWLTVHPSFQGQRCRQKAAQSEHRSLPCWPWKVRDNTQMQTQMNLLNCSFRGKCDWKYYTPMPNAYSSACACMRISSALLMKPAIMSELLRALFMTLQKRKLWVWLICCSKNC